MAPRHDGAAGRIVLVAATCTLLVHPGVTAAQDRRLTLDAIYDPAVSAELLGRRSFGLRWLDDGHYLEPRADDQGTSLTTVDALSGTGTPFHDATRMERALAQLPGIDPEDARRLSHLPRYTLNADATATVLTYAGDLYYYVFGSDHATRLTYSTAEEELASFSPDGRLVAFVRSHDLFLVDVAHQRERRLTDDGGPTVRNGKLDWVYQEEIYGRGRYAGYWWSPDSSRLAFLRFDERDVPTYTVLDHMPYHPEVETVEYPKAGDPNPHVRLGIVGVAGGEPAWVNLSGYASTEFLIVSVSWTPDSRQVVYQVQDREQTWLDLNLSDRATGRPTRLLRETTTAWVNVLDDPLWLPDGSFLWRSERDGYAHLYRYAADGSLIRQVTKGAWEVRQVHGIDPAGTWVYFSATRRSAIGLDLYRVPADGGEIERLSSRPGTHSAAFNPSMTRYLDTWSDVSTPPQVRLHAADGTELRVVDENRPAALADYRLSTPEFLTVTTRDGFEMDAMMIKPPDFDPARRYPVYQHTYAGPHAPQVRNAWAGSTYLFHQLLAQHGIIVWVLDNRTASGKGAVSTWPVYEHFGEVELRDIEDGVAWLRRQPYVDGSRVGISGWSYGGFMVSYALTHSESFAYGIAGGSVTDWRDYDTVYTERYMRRPQDNPEGYRASSPRFAAEDLHGRLLLLHGTMDDNVHLQNTLHFVYALQQAGKQFELMVYPRSRHGVSDPALVRQMRELMVRFVLDQTGAAASPAVATAGRQDVATTRPR